MEDALTQEMKLHRIAIAHQSILEKRMAEKYRDLQRTDRNTPQTNYRKHLIL